jgi:hypothetical protein
MSNSGTGPAAASSSGQALPPQSAPQVATHNPGDPGAGPTATVTHGQAMTAVNPGQDMSFNASSSAGSLAQAADRSDRLDALDKTYEKILKLLGIKDDNVSVQDSAIQLQQQQQQNNVVPGHSALTMHHAKTPGIDTEN